MQIGNVKIKGRIFLAPMAGITNEAFRIICRELGAGLVYSEMVSDKAIVFQNKKTLNMLTVNPEEHPISIQIFGTNIQTFVRAARYVNDYSDCDIIDINMGCPAPKIAVKSQAGAYLLKHPDRVFEVLKTVVENVTKPVTIKIRLGWDDNSINCIEIAKLAEKAGIKAIAVHARTRKQFYTGKAQWEWIKLVKEAVNIPVIANGDIFTCEDLRQVLELTKADAVMIARAAQGNPWIFRQMQHFLDSGEIIERPSLSEWKTIIFRHTELLIKLKGERTTIFEMRKNLAYYFRSQLNASEYKFKATKIESIAEIYQLVNNYIKERGA